MKWWNDPDCQEMTLMIAFFITIMVVGAGFLFVTIELLQVAYAFHIAENYSQ